MRATFRGPLFLRAIRSHRAVTRCCLFDDVLMPFYFIFIFTDFHYFIISFLSFISIFIIFIFISDIIYFSYDYFHYSFHFHYLRH